MSKVKGKTAQLFIGLMGQNCYYYELHLLLRHYNVKDTLYFGS